jgi:hypothetical protein
MGLFADDTALVGESSEANNTEVAELSIEPPPQPDLVISKVLVFPDTSAQPGEEVEASATVLNLGQEEAGPFRVGMYRSDDDLISIADKEMGFCEFAGLAVGAHESEDNVCKLPFTLPEDLRPGTLYIGAIADDEFDVKESDENNNSDYVEVEIGGGCEGVFLDALKECLEAGASPPLECIGQALAALKECQG